MRKSHGYRKDKSHCLKYVEGGRSTTRFRRTAEGFLQLKYRPRKVKRCSFKIPKAREIELRGKRRIENPTFELLPKSMVIGQNQFYSRLTLSRLIWGRGDNPRRLTIWSDWRPIIRPSVFCLSFSRPPLATCSCSLGVAFLYMKFGNFLFLNYII